jgi:hypothetical protein
MPWTKKTRSGRGLSAETAISMGFAALLAVGTLASPAAARDDHDNDRQRSWQDNRNDWHGEERGYYRAPPVVYDRYVAPTYYAPPVVYGPSYGSSPGLTITIQ